LVFQNVLIIADRGTMDASAFIDREAWEKILTKLGLEDIEISDNRYNHVVHMQVMTLQDDDIDFC
jgi:hypothetical protein